MLNRKFSNFNSRTNHSRDVVWHLRKRKMIAVIIKFKVKPNQEKVFVENWKQLTKFIYEYENSLGSRLHKEDDLNFIAYAQWPDKETLHNTDSKLPEEALEIRKRMRDACEKVEKLYELELTEDLLK